METVIRNVGEIDAHDRQALEHLLGQRLSLHQQLEIRIVNLQVQSPKPAQAINAGEGGPSLPPWCNVYAGLSDEEIADLEKTILKRADLSRPSE